MQKLMLFILGFVTIFGVMIYYAIDMRRNLKQEQDDFYNANHLKQNTMEEKSIIEKCKTFAKKADELEIKAFNDKVYQENGFVEDFNKLFDAYCYGKQNRTLSGLNFRQPPRYANLEIAEHIGIEQLSKTRYLVTFEGKPKFKTIRFIVDKRQGEWRLTRFETYVGISNRTIDKGAEIWRKHKL